MRQVSVIILTKATNDQRYEEPRVGTDQPIQMQESGKNEENNKDNSSS